MIEEGTYPARVSSHQFQVSSQKGTEYISLVFKIEPGSPHAGMRVERKGWLTDKAMDYTLRDLRTCGWDGVDLENLGPLDRVVDIVVRHEEDENNNVREVVAYVNELGSGPGGRPMDKGQLRKLAERVKARQAAGGSGNGGGKRKGPDSDIPF